MANVQAVFDRQSELVTKIQQIGTNFSKDSAHSRTSEYLKLRLESLDNLWGEFEFNNELDNLQSIWKNIDKMHLDIDNILEGSDKIYLREFLKHESEFKRIKRELNQKLAATSHLQQATPLLEIPVFNGRYSSWPTFFDLFSDT